jgi:dihydrofolate synthase/folylpolyglutamate synthase
MTPRRRVWADLLARSRRSASHHARDTVSELLTSVGNPHRGLPIIHVAGTNGKTTTARAIDALLTAAGVRVARFTSPHLESPDERITLGGEPLAERELIAAYERLTPALQHVENDTGEPLPFFTALTALALTAFAAARPDVAVVEVGIGGRDDATNVVDGRVAVICPVASDHPGQLGDSIASIAGHKAGVIKPGAQVVMAPQQPCVELILRDRAAAQAATVVPVDHRLTLLEHEVLPSGQRLSLRGYGGQHPKLTLPLIGAYQAVNAMTAIVAAREFLATRGERLDRDAIRTGLARVTAPGRLERFAGDPPVIIDASHNPAGMAVTADAIRQGFGLRAPIGVFAAAADKDAAGMLAELAPVVGELILTASGPRCWDPHSLVPVAGRLLDRVEVIEDLAPAIEQARSRASSGVLITGSVVTAGVARQLLSPQRPPLVRG